MHYKMSGALMLKYRFVSHTADVRFFSYGRNFGELLKNSMLAMFATQADIAKIAHDVKGGAVKANEVRVMDSAETERDLLWYVLQDALSELDAKAAYGYEVKNLSAKRSDGKMHAEASILCIDQKVEYSNIYVKGVSGYTLEVKKLKNAYRASVVIDI
ncbi:archease [Candidatus Marsarchaeota archaeon]|nr:archease [Candidatus Marsarchaeota archaeon]MCL5405094.1 archease [Candidatus Marsarchaeota archaeon]